MNLVDNAQRIEHNIKVLDDRKGKLEKAGAFRKPIEGVTKNPFRRGFDAKYGPVQQVQRIEGSTVVGQDGSRVDIKLVKAVDSASGQPENIERENARTEEKKEKLFDIMEALAEWLRGREMSLK